ncbi:MAG: hypothetical protein GX638_08165 [Crenarchaeota archaeon]|jgi:hypothetical protein|nr:hypothetical protein [Thermoproteota archaeon]HXK72023.1 hypothetical protein [Clostridia bacterium]
MKNKKFIKNTELDRADFENTIILTSKGEDEIMHVLNSSASLIFDLANNKSCEEIFDSYISKFSDINGEDISVVREDYEKALNELIVKKILLEND